MLVAILVVYVWIYHVRGSDLGIIIAILSCVLLSGCCVSYAEYPGIFIHGDMCF